MFRSAGYVVIDYGCEDRKISWRVRKRHLCHSIGLDSIFQKTLIITPPKEDRTVQPAEEAFEDRAFKLGFQIFRLLNHVLESNVR